MKRLTLILPLVLFIILTSCGPIISDDVVAHVIESLTATVLPPTPTNTPDPNDNVLVMTINQGLSEIVDPLSQTIDANYKVLNVELQTNGPFNATTLNVMMRCECSDGSACCYLPRMFTLVALAMRKDSKKVLKEIPNDVMDMQLLCNDHDNPLGTISVPWPRMRDFIQGQINGYQLGSYVRKETFAAP